MNSDNNPTLSQQPGSGGYDNQRNYASKVLPAAEQRQKEIDGELRSAFAPYIETRQIDVVIFERMPATE